MRSRTPQDRRGQDEQPLVIYAYSPEQGSLRIKGFPSPRRLGSVSGGSSLRYHKCGLRPVGCGWATCLAPISCLQSPLPSWQVGHFIACWAEESLRLNCFLQSLSWQPAGDTGASTGSSWFFWWCGPSQERRERSLPCVAWAAAGWPWPSIYVRKGISSVCKVLVAMGITKVTLWMAKWVKENGLPTKSTPKCCCQWVRQWSKQTGQRQWPKQWVEEEIGSHLWLEWRRASSGVFSGPALLPLHKDPLTLLSRAFPTSLFPDSLLLCPGNT